MREHNQRSEDRSREIRPDEFELPSWPTLPEFTLDALPDDGVDIGSLPAGTHVCVRTKNSEYRLTVLEGGHRRVRIQGGILPTASEARLEGSTEGGTAVHRGWIEVNRSLELQCGPRRIITSPVRGISIEKPAGPSSHRAA